MLIVGLMPTSNIDDAFYSRQITDSRPLES